MDPITVLLSLGSAYLAYRRMQSVGEPPAPGSQVRRYEVQDYTDLLMGPDYAGQVMGQVDQAIRSATAGAVSSALANMGAAGSLAAYRGIRGGIADLAQMYLGARGAASAAQTAGQIMGQIAPQMASMDLRRRLALMQADMGQRQFATQSDLSLYQAMLQRYGLRSALAAEQARAISTAGASAAQAWSSGLGDLLALLLGGG